MNLTTWQGLRSRTPSSTDCAESMATNTKKRDVWCRCWGLNRINNEQSRQSAQPGGGRRSTTHGLLDVTGRYDRVNLADDKRHRGNREECQGEVRASRVLPRPNKEGCTILGVDTPWTTMAGAEVSAGDGRRC
jgi:hypothetical protein